MNHFRQLQEQEITFDQFTKSTRAYWMRIALSIHAKGRPTGVDVEDIHQMMLIEAWRQLDKYDSTKSSMKAHLTFCATTTAWREVRRACKLPTDYELPEMSIEASQERITSMLESWTLASQGVKRKRTKFALAAVMLTGSIDTAADIMWTEYREEYKLVSHSLTRRMITKAMTQASKCLEEIVDE